jgi:hypothetical protein
MAASDTTRCASASLSTVATGDLPRPPDFEVLESWAGSGLVIRAAGSDVARWRLPYEQKTALISCGVPLLEGVVEEARFDARQHGGMYRLAGTRADAYQPGRTYLAEPDTGVVLESTASSSGHVRFVNSSINHWLCSLHLVGTWSSTSTALQSWDEDDAMEGVALAELADVLQRIIHLDPPAYGDVGDHETHFWPAVLDRWLY